MQSSPANLADISRNPSVASEIRAQYRSGQLFRERYRVMRVLGRGGFGVTYLCRDVMLPGSPLCVIKQLCPKTQNPMSLERAKIRFRREARILASLGSHSQIPRLLDYFTVKGEFYIVQEFIQGETIAHEVRRNGRQSEKAVKAFLGEILPALKFIHQHRIIHRDIKPPNIIRCREDGRLVLIDFGAVREFLTDGEDGSVQTPITQFVGTPGFAPPEQLALRPCYSSDIYALGMTCLYLLTGRTPVEFETDVHTHEVRWEQTVLLSAHFTKVLTQMLKPSLEDRFQTVEALERMLALEPYLDSLRACMNIQQQSDFHEPSTQDIPPKNSYLTPIQREAAAIRRWRKRRQARRRYPQIGITSEPCPDIRYCSR